MKKRLPLIALRPLAWILFLLITTSGYAQESLIQGLVTDENGEPLIGVSIQDQKTQKGTIARSPHRKHTEDILYRISHRNRCRCQRYACSYE